MRGRGSSGPPSVTWGEVKRFGWNMRPAIKAVLQLLVSAATAGCVPQGSVRHDSPVVVSWQKARTILPGALWGVGTHPTGVFVSCHLRL